MRIRRLQFGLGSLLILTAACAFASQWLRKPLIRAAIEPIGVVATVEAIDAASGDGGLRTARFRIINAGTDTLWYTGYGPNLPLFSWEVERDGVWEAVFSGWCGTGAGPQKLKAGGEMVFEVGIPNRATAVKAGLWVSTSDPDNLSPSSDAAGNQVELWSKPLAIPSAVGTSQQSSDPGKGP